MIKIRGIVVLRNAGHELVDLIVTKDGSERSIKHRLGVDVKPTRGKIITFLGEFYDVPLGDIVWPAHIELQTGGT